MDTLFKIKHLAHKTLLALLGPADLDEHNDPRLILQREYDERFNPRPPAEIADAAQDGEAVAVGQAEQVAQVAADGTSGAPALPAPDQRAAA